MICAKCNKEAKQGKVTKGEFFCTKCVAAAKREAWENQVIEQHKRIAQMVERAERQIYSAKYMLSDLAQLMKDNGMVISEATDDSPDRNL